MICMSILKLYEYIGVHGSTHAEYEPLTATTRTLRNELL